MGRQEVGRSSTIHERFLGQSRDRLPDSLSGQTMSNFHLISSPSPALASRDFEYDLGLFFQDLFLSQDESGLVSLRWACFRLVWPFRTPVDSPRDKRGKSCSRNSGLRFGIRADTGRVSDARIITEDEKRLCSNMIPPTAPRRDTNTHTLQSQDSSWT